MDPYADLHARIDGLCERARARMDSELALEMNDLLSEGYARALLDERRIVAVDGRAVERLRARLDAMHERYLTLRAG